MMMWDVDPDIQAAKRKHKDDLLALENVRSVAIGHKIVDGEDTGEECTTVGVVEKVPESELQPGDIVPKSVGGVETDVVEVDEIEPENRRRSRTRPLISGISCGHQDVTAGTMGFVYQGNGNGNTYVGSNNHVIADENLGDVGDSLLQPGDSDGGSAPEDVFGTLADYVTLEDGVDVDFALAEVADGVPIDDHRIEGVGPPLMSVGESVSVGEEIACSGRTSGVATGTVEQVDASVDIGYSDLGDITVDACIISTNFTAGGDSGSPAFRFTGDGLEAVGRHFAGSSTSSIAHHIQNELTHVEAFDSNLELVTLGEWLHSTKLSSGGVAQTTPEAVLEMSTPA